jgi:hypothetical protein
MAGHRTPRSRPFRSNAVTKRWQAIALQGGALFEVAVTIGLDVNQDLTLQRITLMFE